MPQYVSYDKADNVLFVDFTNMTITSDIFEQGINEVITLAKQLPEKVYLLVCLQNAKITHDVQEDWGKYTQETLPHVLGIVRYAANDVMTNIAIRTGTVRYHTQGNNSHIYPSRQAALEAIRQLEKNK